MDGAVGINGQRKCSPANEISYDWRGDDRREHHDSTSKPTTMQTGPNQSQCEPMPRLGGYEGDVFVAANECSIFMWVFLSPCYLAGTPPSRAQLSKDWTKPISSPLGVRHSTLNPAGAVGRPRSAAAAGIASDPGEPAMGSVEAESWR